MKDRHSATAPARRRARSILWLIAALALLLVSVALWPWKPNTEARLANLPSVGDAARGAYVVRLAGCVTCHTKDGDQRSFLAGGRALKTPFGTFHTPNITPDRDTGIGGWTTEDFVRAMAGGTAPDGSHYYPAFPYTSYARMTTRDIVDLKAYLDTLKPVRNDVPPHELGFPFNLRFVLGLWKRLFFDEAPFATSPERSAAWNRGAYIVNGPGHCRECHTPRNPLGGFAAAHLAGSLQGPAEGRVPNITPHEDRGIGSWSIEDITFMLETGLKPDGDAVGGNMGEVVEHGTSHLTEADLAAVAAYLLSLEPEAGE